ncbi:hypothetical protein [Bacillus sp. 7884-1]|uniref:hypothetical protein n=1 Tax=Bacillus sp. 7884-1 TaxID=2021693 RepID=UPI0011551237|nr:hypothetical protein [Bacillus sp. 7884-1]
MPQVSYGNKELVNRYGIRLKGEDYRQVMIGRLGGVPQFKARMRQYYESMLIMDLNLIWR